MLFAALSRRMPADGGPYAIGAVGGGMAVTLFSYLGVETASVAAAEVRDPSRNVPRATILGTLATAVEYVLALVAVLGILKDRRTAGAQVVADHRQRSEQRRCTIPNAGTPWLLSASKRSEPTRPWLLPAACRP
jgi:amino acid transporter